MRAFSRQRPTGRRGFRPARTQRAGPPHAPLTSGCFGGTDGEVRRASDISSATRRKSRAKGTAGHDGTGELPYARVIEEVGDGTYQDVFADHTRLRACRPPLPHPHRETHGGRACPPACQGAGPGGGRGVPPHRPSTPHRSLPRVVDTHHKRRQASKRLSAYPLTTPLRPGRPSPLPSVVAPAQCGPRPPPTRSPRPVPALLGGPQPPPPSSPPKRRLGAAPSKAGIAAETGTRVPSPHTRKGEAATGRKWESGLPWGFDARHTTIGVRPRGRFHTGCC